MPSAANRSTGSEPEQPKQDEGLCLDIGLALFSWHRKTALMVQVVFAILLCVLASSTAPAQNATSQILLALSEGERNGVFTRLLWEHNEKCDRVIRALFGSTALGLDDCEVMCANRNAYALSITQELNSGIELVSCRDLAATSKRLLHSAGSKKKGTGCKIK
jgi:hypothetical protein